MTMSVIERSIHCPFCGESISILLDLSAGGQSYIEDCQVCCRPIQITFETDDELLSGIQVDPAS